MTPATVCLLLLLLSVAVYAAGGASLAASRRGRRGARLPSVARRVADRHPDVPSVFVVDAREPGGNPRSKASCVPRAHVPSRSAKGAAREAVEALWPSRFPAAKPRCSRSA
jgi:hypothetical protein